MLYSILWSDAEVRVHKARPRLKLRLKTQLGHARGSARPRRAPPLPRSPARHLLRVQSLNIITGYTEEGWSDY